MSSVLREQELPVDSAKDRLEELHKIVSSQTFAKAPRLSSFLSYVVEKSIAGDVDSLTEQQIGIHAFNRPPGYNSNDDNIVRGTARLLRQRLTMYYLTEGMQDTIRIEIPKGAYVAQFTESPDVSELPATEPIDASPVVPEEQTVKPQGRSKGSPQLWIAWGITFVAVAFACWPTIHARVMRSRDKSTLLWNTIFTADKTTFVVPGDAGLNMYEWLETRTVDLNSYSQQSYRTDAASTTHNLGDALGARFYTTMSDLQLVSKLIRLPEADPDRVQVRFARDLTASDIKDANLVLMGSHSYDPWIELFQSSLSLQMSWDVNQDMFTVVNRTPQPGEQAIYQWTVKNGTKGGLTLISLTDNSQGSGRVLLVEGTTMGGVFAGTNFLFDKQLLDPILARARRPDGTVRNFDVLLQSDFIREGVSNLHVLAAHVH